MRRKRFIMRYLAVDVGTEKIGIAISDEDGKIAFPHSVIKRANALKTLLALIKEKNVGEVVVGESLDLKGRENKVMKEIKKIVTDLLEQNISVVLEQEQFTTQAARRIGDGTDDQAAAILLQGYLDRKRDDDTILFD